MWTSGEIVACQSLGPQWLGFCAPAWLSHRMQAGLGKVRLWARWLSAIKADPEGLTAGGCLLSALL